MKKTGILLLAPLLLLAGCAAGEAPAGPAEEPASAAYHQIDQAAARQMMEQEDGHILVDVRRTDEYESGHIPGAICIPNESIDTVPPEELANPAQVILIYCRSGNRSKQAAEKLARMGYSNVYEFGGIVDWTGETVMGQTVVLTVEANPTTGFSWAAAQEAELFDIRSGYTSRPQSAPVSGSGGWQTFLLTPKEAGTAHLTFTYTRPWEPSDADPQFACTFEISEDHSVTVIDDGSAEAAEHGFSSKVKIY